MRKPRRLLVTGGAGFIGSNFVHYWCQRYPEDRVVVLDALTYAGNQRTLDPLEGKETFRFVQGNICDRPLIDTLLREEAIDSVVHFAAESHVDRSILGPDAFIQTNVVGTFTLLEAFRHYWHAHHNTELQNGNNSEESVSFPSAADGVLLHVSTDEVYGSLSPTDPAFTESTPYAPNSPYSASKASSDHFVRAYYHTYKVPTIITNCSNNYGPYQFPEKLIPLMCLNILLGKPLPVYGDGQNIRDWLYVRDHCRALDLVLHKGRPGETYNIGGNNQIKNIDLVGILCQIVDELKPDIPVRPSRKLITFVKDRAGHDRRYAVNATKIKIQLGWLPSVSIEQGLRATIDWYLNNRSWWEPLLSEEYQAYYQKVYAAK